jgi:hypothetical protein
VTSCGQQSSATTGTPTHSAAVCSWPPLTSASSAGSSSHSNHSGPHGLQGDSLLYSSDVKKPSRAASTGPTSTQWPPQGSTHLKSAPTMIKPTRTHGWKSENVLQPIKSRTSPIPYVRRPPGELWQSDSPVSSSSTSLEPRSGSESPRMVYRLVNDSNSLPYSAAPLTPPGLPPHRSELRRSSSDPNLLARVPISLSLASGSQPLPASEQAKSVVPIGAERSRVVSMTPLKSRLQHPKPMPAPTTDHSDPSRYLWYPPLLSPRLQAKWKGPVSSSEDKSFDNPVELGATKVSREDFERLLRQATKNKHASKIISPLSPLRTPAPALSLTSDSAYRSCMPSTFNKPSPRYFKGPEKRLRTCVFIYPFSCYVCGTIITLLNLVVRLFLNHADFVTVTNHTTWIAPVFIVKNASGTPSGNVFWSPDTMNNTSIPHVPNFSLSLRIIPPTASFALTSVR